MVPTDLGDSYQVRHVLKVVGSEINATLCLDLRQGLVDFCAEFFLEIGAFGQLPECKGQLVNS